MAYKKLGIVLSLLFQTSCSTFPDEGRGMSAPYMGQGCKSTPNCRPLTQNEIALAQTVFGDLVNYKTVRIINKSNSLLRLVTDSMSPDGNIYIYDPLTQSADNALESPAHRRNFMHEMTHVWQYQRGMNLRKEGLLTISKNPFNFMAAYEYNLGKDFARYTHEQQGRIVQDYIQLSEHPIKDASDKNCFELKYYQATLSPYLPIQPQTCYPALMQHGHN